MPYAAGGPGDTLTRIIGQGMGKVLGRQFLVENVAGAGGTLGTAKVAASAPDGYSLLVMHFGHAANTALYRNLRYDPIKDFEQVRAGHQRADCQDARPHSASNAARRR